MDTNKILEQIVALALEHGPRLIGAVLIWVIGGWLINIIGKTINAILDARDISESLKPFLKSLFKILLKGLLVITVLGMIGVEMSSFVAIIGAAGLAIGLALSGTLQNFAGGVIILIFKPFRVGDFIDTQGYQGIVKEIQIFNSILTTLDNKTIVLPNGSLSGSSLVNFSTESLRRVDWTFGIAYGDDADKAEAVLKRLCDEDTRILKDPETFIALSALADSSVNFVVRSWVKAEDYWDVFFDMNKNVYKTFNQEGLNIPFPQMDVHVHKD